jgi:glycosyltransferase involved in cell wall biosynthesis
MKISALIPTFNRRPLIARAIESILSQSVPVDEIVIIDDGSTDGTYEWISNRYEGRITVVRQARMGVSAARKRGVEEAHGEWVAFLDSDDEWTPERNAAFLKAISSVSSDVALVFGDTRIITDEGEGSTVFKKDGIVVSQNIRTFRVPLDELVWDMNRARPCVLQSSVIRKAVLDEFNCFEEGLRHSEDFLAGIQIATRYQFAAIPSVVTRLHRTSDLVESSLEATWVGSEDHRRAIVLGYECAARATGLKHWRELHAEAVRGLCKWRAQQGLPIRDLAKSQFKFGIGVRSLLFYCASLLGSRAFRAGFAIKRQFRRVEPGSKPNDLGNTPK